jgi:cytochrome c oxidase subunit 4
LSDNDHHGPSLKAYFGVFAILMVGTFLTVEAARHEFGDHGQFNTLIAMAIASTKAIFVVLYFMHVKYSGRMVWVFSAAGVLWLLILFGLTMADYDTRIAVPGWGG